MTEGNWGGSKAMLSILRRLFSKCVAIDLGTANTLVSLPGAGIVLRQPSYVVFDEETGEITDFGHKAKPLLGRTPPGLRVIRPIRDGMVQNVDITWWMLDHYLSKLGLNSNYVTDVVVGMASGSSLIERAALTETLSHCGFKNIYLVEEPLAAALGADLPVDAPRGTAVVDIGGGTTDISVLSLGGTVYSHSLRVAGDAMDEAIIEYLKDKRRFQVGYSTAEALKIAAGAAPVVGGTETMGNFKILVGGRSLENSLPRAKEISSAELQAALTQPLEQIAQGIGAALSQVSPELAGDIKKYGICLTGGGAKLRDLPAYIQARTGLKVTRAHSAADSVAIGLQRVVDERLKSIRLNPREEVYGHLPFANISSLSGKNYKKGLCLSS